MWIVWALVGVGAAGMALGIWLFIHALRHRRGRLFGILGGVVLILAALVLLACYLPVFVVPDVAAETGTFNRPAPLDGSATVFYLSPADMYGGSPSVPTDTLIAVAARTGAIRWQHTLPGTRSQLAVEGGVAYVATLAVPTGTVTVAAYRGPDGALLWQSTVGDGLSYTALAAASNAVYFLTGVEGSNPQITVTALNASDGMRLWSTAGLTVAYGPRTELIATPDAVYLARITNLQVYRASDGKLLWARSQLSAFPVVGDGVAYLPLFDGGFAAVRAADGAVICQVGGNFDVGSGALDGGTLYLGGIISGGPTAPPPYPTAVYAYDAATCAPRWHVANVGGELAAGGGTVYVEALTYLIALRGSDGKTLWRSPTETSSLVGTGWTFATRPAVLGSTLFATSAVLAGGIHVLGSDGWIHLYAFAGGSGFEYWHVPVGHRTTFLAHLAF